MSVRALKVGEQRQRLRLYDVPESTKDSWAQPSLAPTQIVNTGASDKAFWFFVRPLRGDEMLNVRQIWPTASHILKCRWLGSVIPKTADNPNGYFMPQMKLVNVNDGEVYNVLFAENAEKRNRQWILTCEQKVGATS